MDRRVKYTKKVLNESLIHFLGEKEITRITVTEICRDADVNRSTYYAHFEDPYDQLAKLKAELLGELAEYITRIDVEELPAGQGPYLVLKTLLEYVDRKQDIFRILLGKSGDHKLQEEILDILGEKVFRSELAADRSEEETQYLLMYASNGCFGLFYRWLMSDKKIPAEKLAKLMADYTRNLLREVHQ